MFEVEDGKDEGKMGEEGNQGARSYETKGGVRRVGV